MADWFRVFSSILEQGSIIHCIFPFLLHLWHQQHDSVKWHPFPFRGGSLGNDSICEELSSLCMSSVCLPGPVTAWVQRCFYSSGSFRWELPARSSCLLCFQHLLLDKSSWNPIEFKSLKGELKWLGSVTKSSSGHFTLNNKTSRHLKWSLSSIVNA